MKKVIKYKLSYLLSNKIVIGGTVLLLLLLNFNVLIQSGVLISGGGIFNAEEKYRFLFNNYIFVARGYGLLFAIFLGASIIGPDAKNGTLNIILSAYPSRIKFFLGTLIPCFCYMLFALTLMSVNMLLILWILEIPFVWSDFIPCLIGFPLNSLVILSVTAIGSIFLTGFKSVAVGLGAYAYYNLYMFNQVPLLEFSLPFDVTAYRHVLCHFFPIVRVVGESYATEELLELSQLNSFLPSIELYQIVYVFVLLIVACFLFHKKDLC